MEKLGKFTIPKENKNALGKIAKLS